MSLEYWFMFPISIGVASIAMASGVEGATFFAPIFILGLGFPPEIAIGIGLITEVFGFASGLVAYIKKKLIDYKLGRTLLMVSIPAAFTGSLLSRHIDADILKVILGMGLLAVAFSFLRQPDKNQIRSLDNARQREFSKKKTETCLVSAQGEKICYTVCNKTEGMITAGIGGLFMGLISTGLGEMNGYFLLQRCKVSGKVSVATSVFVVAISALTAATIHLFNFIQAGEDVFNTVLNVVIFTVPGVLVGGQIGASISSRISRELLERSLAILFIIIALFFIGQVTFRG